MGWEIVVALGEETCRTSGYQSTLEERKPEQRFGRSRLLINYKRQYFPQAAKICVTAEQKKPENPLELHSCPVISFRHQTHSGK